MEREQCCCWTKLIPSSPTCKWTPPNSTDSSSTTVENQAIDFHGFQITDNDTALFTVYNFLDNDIISGMIQELNISTGEAIFTWDSIDHIPTSDCYIAKAEGPWDYIVSRPNNLVQL